MAYNLIINCSLTNQIWMETAVSNHQPLGSTSNIFQKKRFMGRQFWMGVQTKVVTTIGTGDWYSNPKPGWSLQKNKDLSDECTYLTNEGKDGDIMQEASKIDILDHGLKGGEYGASSQCDMPGTCQDHAKSATAKCLQSTRLRSWLAGTPCKAQGPHCLSRLRTRILFWNSQARLRNQQKPNFVSSSLQESSSMVICFVQRLWDELSQLHLVGGL